MALQWVFSVADDTSLEKIAEIAETLKGLGAECSPTNDQIVLSEDPTGYARAENGAAVLDDVKEMLQDDGIVVPSDFPSWEALTFRQRRDILMHAAGSLPFVEDASFRGHDLPPQDLEVVQSCYRLCESDLP